KLGKPCRAMGVSGFPGGIASAMGHCNSLAFGVLGARCVGRSNNGSKPAGTCGTSKTEGRLSGEPQIAPGVVDVCASGRCRAAEQRGRAGDGLRGAVAQMQLWHAECPRLALGRNADGSCGTAEAITPYPLADLTATCAAALWDEERPS